MKLHAITVGLSVVLIGLIVGFAKESSTKPEAVTAGVAVILTGIIVNAPRVHSWLKTPARRAAASGVLAAALAVGGLLIVRLVVNAR